MYRESVESAAVVNQSEAAGLAAIVDALGQAGRQAQLLVDRLEQQRTAVRAAVGLIELGDHLLAGYETREENSLCGRMGIHEGLWMCGKGRTQPVSSASEAFVRSTFTNNPG